MTVDGVPAARAQPLPDATWRWLCDRLTRDHRLLGVLTRTFVEEIMAIEVEARCRSATGERVNRRNGYRAGALAIASGPVPVRVPKLRLGGYTPAWLSSGTDDSLTESLLHGYVEGMSTDLVARALAAVGVDGIDAERVPSIAAAMNTLIAAEHVRPLPHIRREDVVIETANGGDVHVGVATTSVAGEYDVLGLAVSAPDDHDVDMELRRDLTTRGVHGDAPPERRRDITIVVRRHGIRAADAVPPRSRRRLPLLLTVAAVLALVAAVVIGTSATDRFRSDPTPPPATTVSPAVSAPTTVTASPPPPSVAPPAPTTAAIATAVECGPTASAARVPWLVQVLCEAAAPSPGG